MERNIYKIGKELFITDNSEIKEGDWCYYLNILGGGNIVCQAYKHSGDKRMLFDDGTYNRKIGEGITPLIGECKKIILTTDQDLIKDGVQAIDDEFLECFIKNPSCEFIEVESKDMFYDKEYWHTRYKIIIPKEEPEQEIHTCKYCGCKWKQERMYSEEDMKNYANYILAHIQSNKWELELTPKEWFQQHKKK